MWRSWLARTAGGREVAGSSPVTPTSIQLTITSVCIIILLTTYLEKFMEILEEPQVIAKNGTTFHVLAVERLPQELNEAQTQEESVSPVNRAIGYVSLEPITIARIDEDDKHPYMYHPAIKVRGVISDSAVYEKDVATNGFLGVYKPFYDFRIKLARRRATKRVNKFLNN